MSIKLKHLIDEIEKFAPIELKEDYDNVGLMVGSRESNIDSILVALDCTEAVIEEALEKKCNLIVTHHPIIFKKPSNITEDTLIGRKLIKLIKNNINVYSAHTNLDMVNNGINDIVVNLLGFKSSTIIEPSPKINKFQNAGIGRLIELNEPISLEKLCKIVKESFRLETIRYSGEMQWFINKIAVINGSGQSYFNMAKDLNADCIITGDTTYHYVSDFYEENISIIDAGHFGTEWPAIKQFALILNSILCELKVEVPIIISERCIDPYKYI